MIIIEVMLICASREPEDSSYNIQNNTERVSNIKNVYNVKNEYISCFSTM